MTRSIGDGDSHTAGVVSTPEIRTGYLDELDEFMIIASDGIWEFIPNDEAIAIVATAKDAGSSPVECAKELTSEARRKWHGNSHIDDITAIVVFLN